METQFAVAINWFYWSTRSEFGDFHNELKSLSGMGGTPGVWAVRSAFKSQERSWLACEMHSFGE